MIPRSRKVTQLGLLMAYAVVLQALEAPLPRILPWAKPGLANSATLIALVLFGARPAGFLVFGRSLLAGLLLGSLFSPGWWLGLSGALASWVAMSFALKTSSRFGMVGLSLHGAAASNLVQLGLAAHFMVGSAKLWGIFPWMMATALPAGILVGGISSLARDYLVAITTRNTS